LLFVLVGTLKGTEQLGLATYGSSQIGSRKNLGMVLFRDFLFFHLKLLQYYC